MMAAGKMGTAVVVSDDHTFLRFMRTFLPEAGFTVCLHEGFDGVVDLVARLRPAVVLIDLGMGHPERSWRCLETLRAHVSTYAVPVLVCAVAGWLAQERHDQLSLHRAAVWQEPFDLTDLARTLAAITECHSEPLGDPMATIEHSQSIETPEP